MRRLGPVRREAGLIHQVAVILAVSVLSGVLIAGLALPWVGLINKGAETSAEAVEDFALPLKFPRLSERTRVQAADGTRLATFYDEDREYVALDQISYTMRQAIISIEDSRFYEHGAIDIEGTGRALVVNMLNGGVVQGGSTITQQLVKLTRLENATTEREREAATEDTKARKLEELRYAIWVEDNYTKNEILEQYLNTAYYGDGAYGIEAAARHYFATTAAELTLPQAALLAGLVKNPTDYDPTNDKAAALSRRNTVLNRMHELNAISKKAAQKAKDSKLGLRLRHTSNGCVSTQAPWFCDYLLKFLLQDPALGKTVEDRRHQIYGGGLTIKSTIDLRFQKAADRSVAGNVNSTDEAIGAIALVEPGTGYVRALAQSRPMGDNVSKGQSFLNYTVPEQYGDANGFQAGSNFKPFVLAAAIQQKVPLNTQIASPNVINVSQASFANCPGGHSYPDTNWAVHNSTGSGTFDLYTGTQRSVNTFYVQLERRTGVCEPWRLAMKMGVNLTAPKVNRVPSFTLGTVDVSPLEMAEAYATFAARGMHCEATPVLEIIDRDGNVIPRPKATCSRVLAPAEADAVNDILKGVQTHGFGAMYNDDINQPSAAKTGTTSDTMAVWFTGYTPNMAAAAVVAGVKKNGDQRDLRGLTVSGTYLTNDNAGGSALAGPVWKDAMAGIERWLPDKDFVPPDPTKIKGRLVNIPSYFGQSPQVAAAGLTSLGFNPQISGAVYSSAPYGSVAYTSPSGRAASGQTVAIFTSIGPAPAPAPVPQPQPQPDPDPNPAPDPEPRPDPEPEPEPTPDPQPSPDPPPGGGDGDGDGGGNGNGGNGNGNGGGGNGNGGNGNGNGNGGGNGGGGGNGD